MNPYFQNDKDLAVTGVIESVIQQEHQWRVRVYGVSWKALAEQPTVLQPGDRVQVVGRQNITLLIAAKPF